MADRLDITTPVHPLPDEIQSMERDETVCKFCGVSYLIHNEIKALEDKLKKTEEKLKFYEGCEEREAWLKQELNKHQLAIDEYQTNLQKKEELVSTLITKVSDKEEKLINLKNDYKKLEDMCSASVQKAQKYQLVMNSLYSNLNNLNSTQNQQKTIFKSMKDDFLIQQKEFREQHSELQHLFAKLQKQYSNELFSFQSKLADVDNKLKKQKQENQQYLQLSSQTDSEISRLKIEAQQCGELRQKCIRQEQTIKVLEKDLEKEVSKSRTLEIQCQQYKDQTGNKLKEIEDLNTQNRRVTSSLEQSIILLQDKLKKKETELNELKMQTTNYRNELERQKISEKEIHRKANMSLSETEEIKNMLLSTQRELDSLKSEREVMITSHQTRIEQLRESFKNKMAEMDNWPQKLEESLKKERSKHLAEMSTVEKRLKDGFDMEIQIERQKHQELIEKYINNAKDEEQKFKHQLTAMEKGFNNEVSDLRTKLEDCKKQAKNKETMLQKEISSLKSIITDLENRLGKLDVGNEEQLSVIKLSLQRSEEELIGKTSENKRLEEELRRVSDEVFLLQETVRRECEERFELTEALSEAREQLLAIKKPSGGYQTPRQSSGGSSSSRRGSSTSLTSIPHPPSVPHPPSPVTSQQPVSSASITMGFEGESSLKSGKTAFKGSAITMDDSRKRIAAMLGRKT